MSGLGVAVAGTIAFGALTLANLAVSRSLLYPGVVLASVWTVVFFALCFAHQWLYPVSWPALGIFFSGACYFTLGAGLGARVWGPLPRVGLGTAGQQGPYKSDRVLLVVITLGLLLGFPLYLAYLMSLSTAKPFTPMFFVHVRQGLLDASESGARGVLVNNLVTLSTIGTLIAFAVTEGGRRWRVLVTTLFLMAISYNLLTASKVGMLNLLMAMLAIYGLTRGRLPVRATIVAGCLVALAFGAITVLRATAQTGNELSLAEGAVLTGQRFLNYFTTSAVAFSLYLRGLPEIPEVWSPWRFFERTLNYFGDFFDVPSLHAKFVEVGPGLDDYNTYTIYFSYYPDYGVPGVCAFMLCIGAIGGLAYRKACAGALLWILFYASLFFGFVMSIFNESLLTTLNPVLKLLFIGAVFVLFRRVRFRPPSAISQRRPTAASP